MSGTHNVDYRDELARLDRLAHREILRLRAAHELTLDELRGIYVSDEWVDRTIAQNPANADDAVCARLTAEAEAIAARTTNDSPLTRMAERFAFDRFERDALLLALAPELDLKYETLYAYLNNNAARRCATVDLALRLFGRDCEHRRKLHSSGRLFREGWLELIESSPPERRSELGAEFALAPAASAYLQALDAFDPRLAGWVEPMTEPSPAHLRGEHLARLSTVWQRTDSRAAAPLLLLESDSSRDPAHAAAYAFRGIGRGGLRVDGGAFTGDAPLITRLVVLARLRGDGVLLVFEDWASESARRALRALILALWRAGVPLAMSVGRNAHVHPITHDLPAIRVRLDLPGIDDRRALWTHALEAEGVAVTTGSIEDVARRFRLAPSQIANAARTLATVPLANAEDARVALFAIARDQSSGDLGNLATPVSHRRTWSDLVLPAAVTRRLQDLAGAVRVREKVFGEWGFGERGGCGLMALFAGASGTGKTMSAGVIAREIGLDLYRVDLATVVSKYIGETEKNLNRVFEAARSANAILFFDEAEALLGKRSEVKDAHDRYANIEVAYLLQKMEEHDGVVVLATNLAKNMDSAFARRMHFVIEFPRPDAALREQLWRRAFPRDVPRANDLDFAYLARQFDLTGGDVKTIALDAAFVAADRARPVTMGDVIGAVSRQLIKQGRTMGAAELRHHRVEPGGVGREDGSAKDTPEPV